MLPTLPVSWSKQLTFKNDPQKVNESEPAGLPLNPDVVRRTLKRRRATAKGPV
jgi:hypothetical protein